MMRSRSLLVQFWLAAGTLAESFDYIVVGAGTAGLVIANRLSEDPAVTVAVVEPGGDERNNAAISGADSFGNGFNTRIDWNYRTVRQPFVNNQSLQYHQGKAIGGTSIINGMNYIRACKAEIDSWETLGNKGWNWDGLFPYYKSSERFTAPSEAQTKAGVTHNPEFHGDSGAVHTGFPFSIANSTYGLIIRETWVNLGIPDLQDSAGGDVRGVSFNPTTIDRDLDLRWDAARAYWHPAEARPNIKMIRGTVQKLVWDPNQASSDGAVAVGVEYLTSAGDSVFIEAQREVVLSAGSMRSPGILEASGVGNPRILEPLGIDVKVNLPGVGENFQEQPNTGLNYASRARLTGHNIMQTFATAADVFGEDAIAALAEETRANITRWAAQIVEASGGPDVVDQTAVETILRVQHDLVFEKGVTAAEVLSVIIDSGIMAANYWWLHPFSRGSVHLSGTSPTAMEQPLIDPRLNMVGFDLTAQAKLGMLTDRFFSTEPISELKAGGAGGAYPGANATLAQWEAVVRRSTAVNSHNIGSASMMSRELGGVVDPELRVYGTSNVRVVDMSIFPLQFSGHPTSTLYAVAERAADIIKGSPLYPI